MKRVLLTLSGLLLLLLLMPMAAQAQFGYATNADNTLVITNYFGTAGVVSIPTNNNGLLITEIGHNAFEFTVVTSVTMPDSITNIGNAAFLFTHLTNVLLGKGITSIGDSVFSSTDFSSFTIPDNITNLGPNAFSGCSSLASITVPAAVASIGDRAFDYCPSMTAITVDAQNPAYSSLNGVLFDKGQGTLIQYPAGGSGGKYPIPNTVTNIGVSAFASCVRLQEVVIAKGVASLGDDAFFHCANLTNIFFRGNPPAIGSFVFDGDTNATAYYLPGTAGWADFVASTGIPAVLWNPLMQVGGTNFGIRNNQFGFNITGTSNIPIVVEACSDLAGSNWSALTNISLTNGLFHFSEPWQSNSPGRFYRISSP